MFKDEIDTVMTVVDDRHLNWTIKDGKASATYMERMSILVRAPLPISLAGATLVRVTMVILMPSRRISFMHPPG